MVVIILGEGFEETEAVAPYDVLKRGGVDVVFAGIGGREIVASHGTRVLADITLEQVSVEDCELVVVPGGLRGVNTIKSTPAAMALIKSAWDAGKRVAAICAGPTVLGELGIMEGVHGVCYPGMEGQVRGGDMSQAVSAVTDGRVTTGRAAGASLEFGLELLKQLRGEDEARRVAGAICCRYD